MAKYFDNVDFRQKMNNFFKKIGVKQRVYKKNKFTSRLVRKIQIINNKKWKSTY